MMTPTNSSPNTARRVPRWLLYLTAFAAGMTSLGIELATARLLGVVLGTSNVVWAVVIALTLLFLTAGYLIGGRWADRSPQPGTLFRIVAWAAFTAGLVPVLSRPLLLAMAGAFSLVTLDALVLGAAGVTVMALFAVPVTLLGCVSPFVVRLAVQEVEESGAVAGRVYAVSTLGSILGTFAPVLALVPLIGANWTFAVFAALLLAIALYGLYRAGPPTARRGAVLRYAWMPPLLAVLLAAVLGGTLKPPPPGSRLLYETETAYNYVQVVEVVEGTIARQPAGTRLLLLNEGQGVHSVYHPERLGSGGTWDMFLAAPYYNPAPYAPAQVERIAVIGLAAGTIAQQYTAVYGTGVEIDGIEIDPGIVEAGRRYFAMTMPNLNVIIEDGRYALRQLAGEYDLVAIDAYRVPYIPWQLTTVEFFREVRGQLAPDGVVMINVGRAATDRRLVDALAATMREVFPAVHAVDVPFSFNTMLTATQTLTAPENLAANSAALPASAHPLLGETLAAAYAARVPVTPSALVFTDDRAPVETLINAMVLEFILGG